ncbi:MAG: hypothetical protein R2806_13050 [Saprospiraceae bacterium]
MRTFSTLFYLFSLLIQPTISILAGNPAITNPVPGVSITAPEDITVSCDEIWSFGRPVITTIGSECVQFTLDSLDDEYDYGDCPQSYVVTRTWIVMDNCQSQHTAFQRITVEDITSPTIVKPADKTVSCSRDLVYDQPVATDNCGTPTVMRFDTIQKPKDCSFEIFVPWIAVDECGNESDTVWQKITLIDTVPPSLSAPLTKTVSCDETWSFDAPIGFDSCSSFSISIESTQTTDILCGQRVVRTWHATDACGNVSTPVSQIVDVLDQTAPSITPAADKTIDCQDEVIWDDPTAFDNCTTASLVIDSTKQSQQSCGYSLTRYWHAVDVCGNVSGSVHQTITVSDQTPPILSALQNKTVNCDDNWSFDMPMVTDNCDPFAFLHQIVGPQINLACGYQITKKWYAIDNCGNVSDTAYQTVTVIDQVSPVLFPLMDKIIDCGETFQWNTPMGTDNCDENLEYNGDEITNEVLECGYRLTRTWYAIDDCGNTSNKVTQSISVIDQTPPTINALPDLTINCGEAPQWDLPTASDNCDENIQFESKIYRISGDCANSWVRSWVAIDHCQNVSDSVKQTAIIIDEEEPNIDEPEDKTIYCGEEIVWDEPTAEDNCDVDVEIIASQVEREDLNCGYILTRSWIAVDNCGNETDPVWQTITVIDTEAPVLSQPEI